MKLLRLLNRQRKWSILYLTKFTFTKPWKSTEKGKGHIKKMPLQNVPNLSSNTHKAAEELISTSSMRARALCFVSNRISIAYLSQCQAQKSHTWILTNVHLKTVHLKCTRNFTNFLLYICITYISIKREPFD